MKTHDERIAVTGAPSGKVAAKKITVKLARVVEAIAVGAATLTAAAVIAVATTTTRARTIVYVANADSREIYVLELNERSGELRLVEKVAVAGSVMPLAVSPDRRRLYASLRSEPYSVSSFAVDQQNGKLTPLGTVPLADNMAYIATDRTGRYLFGASYFGNKISVNRIDPDGRVDAAPAGVITTGKNAHCVLTDPSNKFLFVSNLGDDAILQYRFGESNGAVTPNDPPSVAAKGGAGPRHFVFHPNRRFVYAVNELNGTVDAYQLGGGGTLTRFATASMMPPDFVGKIWAAEIRLTPNGKFLYASERTTSTIAAFRTNTRGELSFVGSYAAEAQPRGFGISPSGNYLVAVGQKSDGLSVYRIARKTGELRLLSRMSVGKNPNWVEIVSLPGGGRTPRRAE